MIAETTPLIHYSAAEKQLFATPADTVLNHFRVVRLAEVACALTCQLSAAILRKPACRQQDQALQSQRHDALQRLSDHHASVAARQHIASGRADSQMALLMQRYNHILEPCYQDVCRSGKLKLVVVCIRNGRKLPPNLMKDATLLMDRARCGRPPSRAGQNTGQSSQLSLATNSASVRIRTCHYADLPSMHQPYLNGSFVNGRGMQEKCRHSSGHLSLAA